MKNYLALGRARLQGASEFCKFFLVQCLMYGLMTWNFRSVAQGRYLNIGASDLLVALIGFKLIKGVGEANTNAAWLGYALGGATGSLLATYLTKSVFGGLTRRRFLESWNFWLSPVPLLNFVQ